MDQIADLLVRIKNASTVSKFEISTSHSKVKEAILEILKAEGFISNFEVTEDEQKKNLKIEVSRTKTPTHLRQLSKAGKKVYVKSKEIPRPLRGLGTVIVSTSKGITTGKNATKTGLGGELICEIW
ncbi:MAG TPA: 30S ribosomal protein S8 [bacterium]|nr:30S ribosomal protein S8 [bacterium]